MTMDQRQRSLCAGHGLDLSVVPVNRTLKPTATAPRTEALLRVAQAIVEPNGVARRGRRRSLSRSRR